MYKIRLVSVATLCFTYNCTLFFFLTLSHAQLSLLQFQEVRSSHARADADLQIEMDLHCCSYQPAIYRRETRDVGKVAGRSHAPAAFSRRKEAYLQVCGSLFIGGASIPSSRFPGLPVAASFTPRRFEQFATGPGGFIINKHSP